MQEDKSGSYHHSWVYGLSWNFYLLQCLYMCQFLEYLSKLNTLIYHIFQDQLFLLRGRVSLLQGNYICTGLTVKLKFKIFFQLHLQVPNFIYQMFQGLEMGKILVHVARMQINPKTRGSGVTWHLLHGFGQSKFVHGQVKFPKCLFGHPTGWATFWNTNFENYSK